MIPELTVDFTEYMRLTGLSGGVIQINSSVSVSPFWG
jgi:hypothetical protein